MSLGMIYMVLSYQKFTVTVLCLDKLKLSCVCSLRIASAPSYVCSRRMSTSWKTSTKTSLQSSELQPRNTTFSSSKTGNVTSVELFFHNRCHIGCARKHRKKTL